jgi:glycosyltransferase involved in cell wall biosynthesis
LLCGTPVLISDRVNIWREIQASGAGVIVSCDVASVTKQLLELYRNPERLFNMGNQAKDAAKNLYELNSVCDRMLGEYQRIINDYQDMRKRRL